jgi:hypothetical protein
MDYNDQLLADRIKRQEAERGDTAFNVRFYYKALQNKYQSELQGRPIFDEIEFVEIRNPGDNWSVINRKVNQESVGGNLPDSVRWPSQYAAFKNGQEVPTVGTPLTEWQLISRTTAEELKLIGIKTLEQLAALPENAARNMIDGVRLKDEAGKHLNKSAKQVDMNKLLKRVELLEAENIALRENLRTSQTETNHSVTQPLANFPLPMNDSIQDMVNQALTKALENMNMGSPVEETKDKKIKKDIGGKNAIT